MDPDASFLILCLAAAAICGCTGTSSSPAPSLTAGQATAVTIVSPEEVSAPCSGDGDCVPAECCHPSTCINKAAQKPCTLLCTASCEGPIDCGAGRCGCSQGRCTVIPASSGPGMAIVLEASPGRYSPLMSSTPGIRLTPNITGVSPGSARFAWNASYGQFLSWNAPDYTIHQLGDTYTNGGEPLYWSFTDRPASTALPVTITVTATNSTSGQVLGTGAATLIWDGEYAVTVHSSE